jgi:hypothetical protein
VLGSAPTTTTVTTGVYQHVFPWTNTNQHQSLSITTADDIQDYIYPLGMVNSFEMEAQINNYITSVISLLAKIGQSTTANPSYIEDCPFTSRYMSIYIADTVEDLDDADKANLTSFTMTINKNLEQEFAIGEVDPKEISNKQFSIEGSLAYNHTNDTYRNMVLSNTFKAMKIEIKDTSVNLGSDTNPTLTFILPKISMTEISRDQSNDSLVNETVSFKGMFDLSSGVPIQATLINKQSSY